MPLGPRRLLLGITGNVIVNVQNSSSVAATSPLTLNLAATPTANNWLTVVVGGYYGSGPPAPKWSVSGGGVGTWASVGGVMAGDSATNATIFYGQITGTPTTSVTVTAIGSFDQQQSTVSEWSGLLAPSPFDASVSNSLNSTAASAGPITPSTSNELFIVGYSQASKFTSWTPPTGWNVLGTTTNVGGFGAWLVASGTENPVAKLTSGIWSAAMVALKPSLVLSPTAAAATASVSVATYSLSNLTTETALPGAASIAATAYAPLTQITATPTVAAASVQAYIPGTVAASVSPGFGSVAATSYTASGLPSFYAGVASVSSVAYSAASVTTSASITAGGANVVATAYLAAASTNALLTLSPESAPATIAATNASVSASVAPTTASTAVAAYAASITSTWTAGAAAASVAALTLPGTTTTKELGNTFIGTAFTGIGPLGGYGTTTLSSGVDVTAFAGIANVAPAANIANAAAAATASVSPVAFSPNPTVDVTFWTPGVSNLQGLGILGWALSGGYAASLSVVVAAAGYNVAPTLAALPPAASVSSAASQIIAGVTATAGLAAVAISGLDATVNGQGTTVTAQAAGVTVISGTSYRNSFTYRSALIYPASAVTVTITAIPNTGAASTAAISLATVYPGVAAATTAAYTSSASIGFTTPGIAGASITASQPMAVVSPTPGTASATLAAYTASVLSSQSGVIGAASVTTITAYQPAASITAIPITAAGTWAAYLAESNQGTYAPSTLVAASVVAYDASASIGPTVNPPASVAATAYNVSQTSNTFTAGIASVSVQSYDMVNPVAGLAAGTWAAYLANIQAVAQPAAVAVGANTVTPTVSPALAATAASVSASPATEAITATGLTAASVVSTAYGPQIQTGTSASVTPGVANASAAAGDSVAGLLIAPLAAGEAEAAEPPVITTQVFVTPLTATVTLTAFSPPTISLEPAAVIAAAFDGTVVTGPTFTPGVAGVECTAYAPDVVGVAANVGSAAVDVAAYDINKYYNPGAEFTAGLAYTGWNAVEIVTGWTAGSDFTIWSADLLTETELV